jgi:hypothetical protein
VAIDGGLLKSVDSVPAKLFPGQNGLDGCPNCVQNHRLTIKREREGQAHLRKEFLSILSAEGLIAARRRSQEEDMPIVHAIVSPVPRSVRPDCPTAPEPIRWSGMEPGSIAGLKKHHSATCRKSLQHCLDIPSSYALGRCHGWNRERGNSGTDRHDHPLEETVTIDLLYLVRHHSLVVLSPAMPSLTEGP